MLLYEKEIIEKTAPEGNILVLAKGLSLHKIMATQISFYDFPGSFVFVLNVTQEESSYLQEHPINNLSLSLPSSLERRKELYARGGIIVPNHQTVLTDLLNGNINPKMVSALFVANIENIGSDSMVAFIIDSIKALNKDVVIRGFTDNPVYLDLDLARGVLQTNKVFIYPRFHDIVQESLVRDTSIRHKKMRLGREIEELQILIMEIFRSILNELKKHDKYNRELNDILLDFDLSKISLIVRTCKSIVERSGHKSKVRQLVQDIRNFSIMIDILFSVDFGCFLELLKTFWAEQITLKEKSTWVNSDSGLMLMEKAIEFQGLDIEQKKDEIGDEIRELRRIKRARMEEESNESVQEVVEGVNIAGFSRGSKHSKTASLIELIRTLNDEILILVKSLCIKEYINLILDKHFPEIKKDESKKITVATHYEYKFIKRSFNNIIFLNPDLGSVRIVENRQNTENLCSIKTENAFFLIYKDSLEEQKYLHEIRHEKEAFKKLIDGYSRMPLATFDTKIVLDEEDEMKYEVLVDYREMRSSLPYFLFRSGNRLKIVTLETGDYILGKDTCVERKTIADFISSLNAGRLYFQLRMMSFKYKNIYLLLEFIGRRPCLSDFYESTDKNSLVQRFVLLLLNFPKLKVMWSSSSLESVRMFRIIQKRVESPTEETNTMDPILLELLLSVPGVDFYNYKRIIDAFDSIEDIAKCGLERLITVAGSENGQKIFRFFNDKFMP